MRLQETMPWLIATLVLSVVGMVIGGRLHQVPVVVFSAGTFAIWIIAIAILANLGDWRGVRPDAPSSPTAALHRNSRLMTVAYAWGAMAMQGLYTTPLTGLKWQHGWQYALLMMLMALGAFHFSRALASPDPARQAPWVALAVPLAIANAFLAAGGLVYLAVSGKLLLRRSDWAANQVFLFGALIVMVLAAVTLKTHARLTRQ